MDVGIRNSDGISYIVDVAYKSHIGDIPFHSRFLFNYNHISGRWPELDSPFITEDIKFI